MQAIMLVTREIVGHFGKEDDTELKFVSDRLVWLQKEVARGHTNEVEAAASAILCHFIGKPDIKEFGWILERLLRFQREIGAPLPDLAPSEAWLFSAKAFLGLDENHPKVARILEIIRKKEAGEITIEEHKEFVLLKTELEIVHGKRTQAVRMGHSKNSLS
jgi:hypothetical protein